MANDEAFVGLKTDDAESLKIHDNSVELRIDEHEKAINAYLSILCLQLGFSAGTFTFDRAQGLKTATEVISENSKTYKTIKGNQLQVKMAIAKNRGCDLYKLPALYDVRWNGYSIRTLAKTPWETKVVFDDSILQDRQTNINEGILLTTNGLMSKKRFMVEKLGYTEEEAMQELEEIRNESTVNASAFDFTDRFTQEGQSLNPNATPQAEEEREEAAENEA